MLTTAYGGGASVVQCAFPFQALWVCTIVQFQHLALPLLDEDYLILSTIHSAKGQERKMVFVLNVVDGCLPSDLGTAASAEIEEERRLLYVAMTGPGHAPQMIYT